MPVPLLATKLNIPPLRPRTISRPRLFQALDAGLEPGCLLTLVCAPAGYGKTTLLSEWLQRLAERGPKCDTPEVDCAWLALDQRDDDLACFLQYLVAALQRRHPEIGASLLTALQTPRPASEQMLATLLINDLAELPVRMVVVVDDYHLITAQPVHSFLSYLVEHQAPQLNMVIASRADPPLPLARWRARGQLVEVRQGDLRFTHEESADLLGEALARPLTSAQLTTLENRTEGWGTGLQLAALSMRNITDVSAFIDTFSGGHEHVADYLTDEVIAQQPETVVAFLLQTSILECLTAPLCEAVTGQTQAQAMLETLMEMNLFLVPLDQQQEWYRYHPLFSDLLRRRLVTFHSEQVGELHRRASRWYQENGFLAQAIDHALAGQDPDRAAVLIEDIAEDSLASGKTVTLLRWLEALPASSKDMHLRLWVLHDLALLLYGKPDTPVQDAVARISRTAQVGAMRGEIALLHALRAVMTGQTDAAISLAESALQQLPPGRLFFRSLAADSLGMAHTLRGDTTAAIQAFEQVVNLSRRAGGYLLAVLGLSSLAGLHYTQGHLRAAASMYRDVMELAEEHLGKHSIYTGRALLGLGELAREWDDLDAALRHFLDSAEALGRFSEIGLALSYLSIARVKLSQCDWDAAQDAITQARRQARETSATQLDDQLVDLMQARYWIVHGEADLALQWARSSGLREHPTAEVLAVHGQGAAVSELTHGQYLILARLYLALAQPRQALQIIEPLLDTVLKVGHNRRALEYLILKALALQQAQLGTQAVEAIGQALALGETEGFRRVFLDEGRPIAHLLYQAVERDICPVYAGRLLAGFPPALTAPGKAATADAAEALIERLSEREKEVLTLVAAGLSNNEIAGRLYISLSTVKGHIANIFGKLDCRSRVQAVSRARDLGLIPDG